MGVPEGTANVPLPEAGFRGGFQRDRAVRELNGLALKVHLIPAELCDLAPAQALQPGRDGEVAPSGLWGCRSKMRSMAASSGRSNVCPMEKPPSVAAETAPRRNDRLLRGWKDKMMILSSNRRKSTVSGGIPGAARLDRVKTQARRLHDGHVESDGPPCQTQAPSVQAKQRLAFS